MADITLRDNHLCAFSVNGQYCPLPGASCDTTHAGPSTKWYCRYHSTSDKRKDGVSAFNAILRGEIGIEKRNWRDILMDDLMAGRVKIEPAPPKSRFMHNDEERSLLEAAQKQYGAMG